MNLPPGRGALVLAVVAIGVSACSSDRDAASTPPFGSGSLAPPASAEAAPVAATQAIPIDSVAMVGDSITVGSLGALEEGFASLGLDDVEIDAIGGRRMLVDGGIGSGLDAVTEIAGSDQPDLWVIALGTNDVGNYAIEEYGPAIDELVRAVPGDAPIVWVNTYLDASATDAATFNDILRFVLTARGRSTVVDWASIAAQDGVLSDGVHPSGFGVGQFSERIVAAVDDWMA